MLYERKVVLIRRGYPAELEALHLLQQAYGKNNVMKVAIGSFGSDFIIFSDCKNEIRKLVEIKQCFSRKKFRASAREKEQLKRISEFAKSHAVAAEVWVKYFRKPFEKHPIGDFI